MTHAWHPGVRIDGRTSSYTFAVTLYETGLDHLFRGKDHPGGGDRMFLQRHTPPGPYARAFPEGRLSEAKMDGLRQQTSSEHGLPSRPYPHQLPNF